MSIKTVIIYEIKTKANTLVFSIILGFFIFMPGRYYPRLISPFSPS